MKSADDPVLRDCLSRKDTLLDNLQQYVSCQSVSTDPAYEPGMEAARQWLEQHLTHSGFEQVQRLDADGHPALFAQWLHAPGKPTLLVYGHYDVQPPDPVDQWLSPPFETSQRDERLYARGISDDKGPSLIALDVLAAYLRVEKALPVNIKILLEGEEETGSPSLPRLLNDNRQLLSADAVLSADGARWRADLPAINVGSRGNGGFGFRITTAAKDLHSGRFGGAVPNALHTMSALVASLHNQDGSIAIDGFYDDVQVPTAQERKTMEALPFDEDEWAASLSAKTAGESGWSTLERLWVRPTIEINGLWGGYQGTGAKTVIPNEAKAKLTTRMVSGQDPANVERSIRAHLQKHCPPYAAIEFEAQHGWVGAYSVPESHPLLLAAERALKATTGKTPVRVRIGATLPLTDVIHSTLGIDTIMFSFSTADEDFHAPNEFLRLSAIDDGLAAWVQIIREVVNAYE